MNDIGKELYERVRADFERRLAAEKHPPKDMRGVSDYSARVGRYLAEAIAANVTEDALPDRRLYYNIAESILEPSLRTNYELVNDTAAEVQRLLDERQGLRIKPARADYPEERVHAVIGAASEEGIEFGKALRRMTSPAENITQSFADDFMQANAEQRSRAGFDTFIERQGGFNCCPWCAGLVGVFAYPKGLPKEVFARHDNCTCSVTYGTKGGARQNAWTKAKWNVPPIEEPHRMTAEEAAEKGAFAEPKRLTGGANGGILSYNDILTSNKPVAHDAEKRVPTLDIFGADLVTDPKEQLRLKQLNQLHARRSQALLQYVRRQNAEAGTEYSMIYNAKMNTIQGRKTPQKGIIGSVEIPPVNEPFHAFHNHGSSETLGIVDIKGFSLSRNMKSLTAQGNNGASKFTIIKTEEYNELQYSAFVYQKSNEPFYFIGDRGIILNDFIGEENKKSVKELINSLPEEEQEIIQNAILAKTIECLEEGEKYGVRYIHSNT